MLNRDCQHHRHGHLHEPRFSTTGDSFGIHAAHAVGRRRYRSALRRALLRGAQRRAAALWRRISFSLTDLSPGARVYGGIHFCHGGVCRADRTRRHGFWQIHARRPRLRFTGHSLICGRLAGGNLSSKNLQVGSAFQNLWTIVKLLLVGTLITAGLFVEPKQEITFLPQPGDTMSIFSGAFAVALVYVMYSYSGWNASSYIIGEVKKPEKNVPRSLLAGTLIVIVAYVLLNAIFLATTPQDEMRGQLEVGLIAGKHIFGTNGGRVAGAVICLGLVSAISSMTWIGPRVSMSMGEDHWLLRLFGRKNLHGIPTNAIVLQLLIINVLLLTRSFESVVQYTQFSLLLCSLFTVVGVIVLRATRPEIARPYRVWAYPIPPIIFAVITLWMMFYLLRWKTVESLAGLATALVGLLLYFCARNRPKRHRSA